MHRFLALLCTLVLGVAACTSGADPAADPSTGPVPGATDDPSTTSSVDDADTDDSGTDAAAAGAPRRLLRPFDSCDALLAYYRDNAADLVGPYGLGGGGFGVLEGAIATTEAAAADSAAGADVAQATSAAAPAPDGVSGTNVQEQGVDEPDLVKTDGEIIVTTVNGTVQVVDVASEQVVATVPLPADSFAGELLLDGDTLLVLSSGAAPFAGGPADLLPAYQPTRTVVTRIDLSDPAAPTILGSVRMEGGYRSARMIDGTVRMVMVSEPTGLAFTQPTDGGLSAEQEATERNQQILAESNIDDWIPHLQPVSASGETGPTEPILDCTEINEPAAFAGLSTLSVLTFDLRGDGLAPTSGAGLVAAGDTVYASTDRLVVATSPWGGWVVPFIDILGRPAAEEIATDLHSFDITDPAATRYVASGSVGGTLINSFALSEVGGVIRVATTTEPDWFGGGASADAESQSSLVVLAEEGERLVETGRLDGLGITERIYAVRYLGPDLAAVVTFRQTDPLYLIDTSDPTAPALLGELSIPGFSSYLHPVAEGWLLGVGQDADPETGQTLGLQASLFDIRDLANPQRVAQVDLGEGYSPVEYDHRAFLQWAPTGQVVIPAELYGPLPGAVATEGQEFVDPYGSLFAGAVVLDVAALDGAGALTEAGRVANRDLAAGEYAPGVIRSLVIGESLWTLTNEGLARHGLAGLDRQAVVPLI